MKSKIICLLACLATCIPVGTIFAVEPPENDDTIRVLVVVDSLTDLFVTLERMEFLEDTWPTVLGSGVGIEFANLGLPITYGEIWESLEGTASTQLEDLQDFVNRPSDPTVQGSLSIRDVHAADVVIGVSREIGPMAAQLCGEADMDLNDNRWVGVSPSLQLDGEGLDLRGQDISFVAVTSQQYDGPKCQYWDHIIAHEFGHLLGAGHYYLPAPPIQDRWLYTDSRADRRVYTVGRGLPQTKVMITALGMWTGADCDDADTGTCELIDAFSSLVRFVDPNRNNLRAINDTSLSVANYRQGPPTVPVDMCQDGIDNDGDSYVDTNDPECTGMSESPVPPAPPPSCTSATVPYNVEGYLQEICMEGTSATLYRMLWSHHCPTEVTRYEIYYSQPDGAANVWGWNVVQQFTDLWVLGVPSRVRVRSCGPGGCSQLSASSFLAVDQC